MLEGGYNPKPIEYFIKGDPVEVKDGPLKGLIGEVTQIDRDNHLIRVDAIQHSISVKIRGVFLHRLRNYKNRMCTNYASLKTLMPSQNNYNR